MLVEEPAARPTPERPRVGARTDHGDVLAQGGRHRQAVRAARVRIDDIDPLFAHKPAQGPQPFQADERQRLQPQTMRFIPGLLARESRRRIPRVLWPVIP